jgi:CBS domain-containing protein
MQVSVLLQAKGPGVVTVRPEVTVREVAGVLGEHRIGAVVVSADGATIDGVLSERDIVRALAASGADALDAAARELMTTAVFTCQPDTTVEELMSLMTEQRIRHVPVLVDGSLAGVVSIGDVVKDRISSLEHETKALHDYIANPF